MPLLDRNTLHLLSEKGVGFALRVPSECGQDTYFASAEDLEVLMTDAEAIYAKAHGVTKAQYRDWMGDGCMVFCSAQTLAGKPCRNLLTGGFQVTAKQWAERQGEYCAVHNGERRPSR